MTRVDTGFGRHRWFVSLLVSPSLFCSRCVRQDPLSGAAYQTVTMRTLHPDDASMGNLLLSTPNVLVHEVDVWSPLCPSQSQARARMDALSKSSCIAMFFVFLILGFIC